MKNLLLLFLLLNPAFSFAQFDWAVTIDSTFINQLKKIKYFKLTDTTFKIDDIYIVEKIYFNFGESKVLKEESKQSIDSLVLFLKENPNLTIEIGAHLNPINSADNTMKTEKINEQRALSIKKELTKQGVKKKQLKTKGYILQTGFTWKNDQLMEDFKKLPYSHRRIELKILKTE
jgi:hypothetical protein